MKKTIIVVASVLSIVTYYSLVSKFYGAPENPGEFGDMFGGLAFLGILITIYLQKSELELQRQELQNTREELKRTADAQESSQIALNKQAESLKMTAKLNGLSSMLQFELAKPNTQKRFKENDYFSNYIDTDKAESIIRDIQSIIDGK